MHRLVSPALALCLFIFTHTARADVEVPPNVLNPATPTEAWNVIRLATRNVAVLLEANRFDEIAMQVSLCSPSIRTLARTAASGEDKMKLDALSVRAFASINGVATGGISKDRSTVAVSLDGLKGALAEMRKLFDPKVTDGEIYFCPVHPEFISVNVKTVCGTCGLDLAVRRIPYSFIYVAPGAPTLRLSATAEAPLEVGREARVKLRLAHEDGRPVLLRELLVMHTQPIHFLILDSSLEDFHREHPQPTETPGEYAFTFTPAKPGPYRVWADVVPAATGLREYPTVDLPAAGIAEPIANRDDHPRVTAGGLTFTMTFADQGGSRPRKKDTRFLRLTVNDAEGKPVNTLTPVMNAFAHLVGFYEDQQTIVHVHPTGGDILRDDVRGGPNLGFKFFAPKAGHMRLFAQVLVDGKTIYAPFTVNISE